MKWIIMILIWLITFKFNHYEMDHYDINMINYI